MVMAWTTGYGEIADWLKIEDVGGGIGFGIEKRRDCRRSRAAGEVTLAEDIVERKGESRCSRRVRLLGGMSEPAKNWDRKRSPR